MATIRLDWENIVGKKADVEDDGYVGDIMAAGIKQLEPLLATGTITQETQSMVITQLIDSAIGKAIAFEEKDKSFEQALLEADRQYELTLDNSNRDYKLKERTTDSGIQSTQAELAIKAADSADVIRNREAKLGLEEDTVLSSQQNDDRLYLLKEKEANSSIDYRLLELELKSKANDEDVELRKEALRISKLKSGAI